jgi:hypothetical protein
MGQKRTPTRIQLTARLAALFFCCLCLRGPAEANETSGETPAARTDQAEIALKLEKGYSTVSCPLVAEVTNRSTRDILINMGESFAMMSFDIKLSNRDGPLLDKSARLPCSGPAEMFVIKPGATRKVIIPLDHYFDLDAGEWALDLSWKEFPGLRLPTLNFKIPDHPKPPPGRFANAVGSTRLALARYFEVHGYFPNTLDEMDEKVEGTGGLRRWKIIKVSTHLAAFGLMT